MSTLVKNPQLYTQVANKNYLINGNFDVWQRGTSIALTTTNDYTADRWRKYTSTAGDDVTVSQQTASLNGSRYSMRVQRPSGQSTTNPIVMQYAMETQDSIPLRGQRLTLSFWAKKGANFSAASDILVAKIVTGKGTDQKIESFTTSADAISENKTLTSDWQKFTITTTNIIASDITQIGVTLSYTPVGTASTNDWYEVTQVKLEQGSVATPFVPITFDEELRACQRYAVVLEPNNTVRTVGSTVSTPSVINIYHPVTTRLRIGSYSVTITGTRGTNWSLRQSDDGVNTTGTLRADPAGGNQQILLRFEGGTYTAGTTFHIFLQSGSSIVISAEL